jgi:hypothetical protein
MRADVRTAVLATMIAFAPHADAQEAAAKGCEAADLAGTWILTFQREQPSVGPDLTVLARLAGDGKRMTGILGDDQENHFALTGFRWKLEPLRR